MAHVVYGRCGVEVVRIAAANGIVRSSGSTALTQSRLCLTLRVLIRATEGIAICRESYGCDWVDATL